MQTYQTPGVYLDKSVSSPRGGLSTGVPVFIGQVETTPSFSVEDPETFSLSHWQEFSAANKFGAPVDGSYLFNTVKGFFENGGKQCYVLALSQALDENSLLQALQNIEIFQRADLVCVPDIISPDPVSPAIPDTPEVRRARIMVMQNSLLNFCEQDGSFFAILDSMEGADLQSVIKQRDALNFSSGALYYPWVQVADAALPSCGHIAGIYARTDENVGVFKSPANEIVREVQGLVRSINAHEHSILNPQGINTIRAFPGRGIRVMGARALAQQGSPFGYVSARRLLITLKRWASENLLADGFEPNTPILWARIVRKVGAYLNSLYVQGAFQGENPEQAYYIKCDAENNPEHIRDNGVLVVEVGIIPADVNEFIVLKLVRNEQGLQLGQFELPGAVGSGNAPEQNGNSRSIIIERVVLSTNNVSFEQEHVVLRNSGQYSLDLSEWLLRDQNNSEYRIPDFVLEPYASVKIWTISGRDDSANLYWGQTEPVWTNGNFATLSDGQVVIFTTDRVFV